MDVDIRFPIGFMFSILGLLLTIFGLVTSGDTLLYGRSLGVNVNLWSGLMMVVFWALMLIFAFRSKKLVKKPNP
jgi:hypothetical protein